MTIHEMSIEKYQWQWPAGPQKWLCYGNIGVRLKRWVGIPNNDIRANHNPPRSFPLPARIPLVTAAHLTPN